MINLLGWALENIMYKGEKGYFFFVSPIGDWILEIRQGTYFFIYIYIKAALVKSKCLQDISFVDLCRYVGCGEIPPLTVSKFLLYH